MYTHTHTEGVGRKVTTGRKRGYSEDGDENVAEQNGILHDGARATERASRGATEKWGGEGRERESARDAENAGTTGRFSRDSVDPAVVRFSPLLGFVK